MPRPSSSPGAAAEAAHRSAVAHGEPGYFDPHSGLFVFTAAFLAARDRCCGSGCRHCPYPLGGGAERAAEPTD